MRQDPHIDFPSDAGTQDQADEFRRPVKKTVRPGIGPSYAKTYCRRE